MRVASKRVLVSKEVIVSYSKHSFAKTLIDDETGVDNITLIIYDFLHPVYYILQSSTFLDKISRNYVSFFHI